MQDRKKIQYLLALGVKIENETTYFRPKVANNAISTKEHAAEDKENAGPSSLGAIYFRDTEEAQIEVNALKLRVTALQTQLSEQVNIISYIILHIQPTINRYSTKFK